MTKANRGYKLIFMFVAVISSLLLVVEIALAWFMSSSFTDNSDTGVKVIGRIDLVVEYDFSFYNDALSPDTYYLENKTKDKPTATTIKTADTNNIDGVFVKVKFITNTSQLSLYFDGNLLASSVTSYDSSCDNNWYLSSYIEATDETTGETRYTYEYYYIGLVGNTAVTFNKGYYVNNHIDNSYAEDDVYIKMEVYGLQSQYDAYLYETDWLDAPDLFKDYAASPKDD